MSEPKDLTDKELEDLWRWCETLRQGAIYPEDSIVARVERLIVEVRRRRIDTTSRPQSGGGTHHEVTLGESVGTEEK